MDYDAQLTNPKPPGQIQRWGHLDLGWPMIRATRALKATTRVQQCGSERVQEHRWHSELRPVAFEGALSSMRCSGRSEGSRLQAHHGQQPGASSTKFEVLVDGTNGNTMLKPVRQTRLDAVSQPAVA